MLRSWSYPGGMCGRYTNTVGPEELGKQLGDQIGVKISGNAGTGRYRINPTEDVLAIVIRDGEPDAAVAVGARPGVFEVGQGQAAMVQRTGRDAP